jgi:hypothetical protein
VRELSIILNAGDAAAAARTLRDMPEEHLAQTRSPKALRRAASLLRMTVYLASTAATRLERRARELEQSQTPVERIGEATRASR